MPLIIMTGVPCSGKSTRVSEIKSYFQNLNKEVQVISEEELISDQKLTKNEYCFDAGKEKQIRAEMKSNVQRVLKSDVIVIIDAGNYIKGYRYELYCLAKTAKSTQCIVECDSTPEKSWEMNENRNVADQYSKEAFDSLVHRQEPPNCWNRWDKPLITIQLCDTLPGDKIYAALYNKKPLPPNKSTQSKAIPLSSSNYVNYVDGVLQEVCEAVSTATEEGKHGENVVLDRFKNCVLKNLDGSLTFSQLTQYRKQFLSFNKLKPLEDSREVIASAFLDFINSDMHQYVPGLFNQIK